MQRNQLADLSVFAAVAGEGSFTAAAIALGTSQSAVSQAVRRLEDRLAVRLLARTTRSVGLTEAGERLLEALRPAFDSIQARLDSLGEFRDRPSGRVRITCSHHAAETVLWPAVDAVMAKYPEVQVELSLDGALTNIVADRFDAGVRLGEQIDQDMIALRIGPDLRMIVVGSPDYFARHPVPQTPRELIGHDCINLRMATHGDLYVWEFEKDGAELNVRVTGRLVVNDGEAALAAARSGHGLAYAMEDRVRDDIAQGRLVAVLADWSPPFAGHHLYYPNRHATPPALRALIDELIRLRPA
jgi:DNA-binding transcriptional LysR family regulator